MRLFKREYDISEAQFLDEIYSHKYKHGWNVSLIDDTFNKYYKQITGFTHIAVNYNRKILHNDYSCTKEILFFRDLLEHEINATDMDKRIIDQTYQFLMHEEYDSESIIDDILCKSEDQKLHSNIKQYFISNNAYSEFTKFEKIVNIYTSPAPQLKPKSCNTNNVFDVSE
eukprot:39567_1